MNKIGTTRTFEQCIIFVSWRCDECGYKSLLDCMIIDVKKRRCMTKLGLPPVNELKKRIGKK